MHGSLHRRIWVLLSSAAAAIAVWKNVPGSTLDHAAFETVARSFANPPLSISGNGSYENPWKLAALTASPAIDPRQAPVIVSLGDDVEGLFQSSPPSPIDAAVIFNNFQRLGAKNAATAAVFAWEAPDAIGLAALDKALGKFDSLVMAAPLSRGSLPSPMPPSFRRASLPLTHLVGDASALPLVNRIPLPGIILGGENSVAGFSLLESEPPSKRAPLMARWGDRIVFSFPLLTVLQRNHFPLDQIEIRLGETLKLSANGPVLPIDSFGCLATEVKPSAAYAEFPAEALIDGNADLFPKAAPDPVILRDDRSNAESTTRNFSESLSGLIAVLASNDGFSQAKEFPRLPMNWELGLIGSVIFLLTAYCGLFTFARRSFLVLMVSASLTLFWVGIGMAAIWLPMIPILSAILMAALVSEMIRVRAAAPSADIPLEQKLVAETVIKKSALKPAGPANKP